MRAAGFKSQRQIEMGGIMVEEIKYIGDIKKYGGWGNRYDLCLNYV